MDPDEVAKLGKVMLGDKYLSCATLYVFLDRICQHEPWLYNWIKWLSVHNFDATNESHSHLRLRRLRGHTAEVSGLAFGQIDRNILVSTSFDARCQILVRTLNDDDDDDMDADDEIANNQPPLAPNANANPNANLLNPNMQQQFNQFNPLLNPNQIPIPHLNPNIPNLNPNLNPNPNLHANANANAHANAHANANANANANPIPNGVEAPGVVYEGHEGQVSALAYAPNGKLLATGSADKTIRLWEMPPPALRRRSCKLVLKGHVARIASVAFHPTSKILASGGWDEWVKIWSAIDGTCLFTIDDTEIYGDMITAVKFSPNGRLLVTACDDLVIRIHPFTDVWDANGEPCIKKGADFRDNKQITSCFDHKEVVKAIAFSACGKVFASASNDKFVKIWNVGDYRRRRVKPIITLKGHQKEVAVVEFSPDTFLLASGGNDGIIVWGMPHGSKLYRTDPDALIYEISSMTFSSNSTTLAAGYKGGEIILYECDIAHNPPPAY